MNAAEKATCEMILNEGVVLQKFDGFSKEGIHVECWSVEYLGEKYTMTKNNGEWIYFLHN